VLLSAPLCSFSGKLCSYLLRSAAVQVSCAASRAHAQRKILRTVRIKMIQQQIYFDIKLYLENFADMPFKINMFSGSP
jgi:hypothetical protein